MDIPSFNNLSHRPQQEVAADGKVKKRGRGQPPKPGYVSANFRMPKSLLTQLQDQAKKESRTYSGFIINAVKRYLEEVE